MAEVAEETRAFTHEQWVEAAQAYADCQHRLGLSFYEAFAYCLGAIGDTDLEVRNRHCGADESLVRPDGRKCPDVCVPCDFARYRVTDSGQNKVGALFPKYREKMTSFVASP